jgi:hypothetical protein
MVKRTFYGDHGPFTMVTIAHPSTITITITIHHAHHHRFHHHPPSTFVAQQRRFPPPSPSIHHVAHHTSFIGATIHHRLHVIEAQLSYLSYFLI